MRENSILKIVVTFLLVALSLAVVTVFVASSGMSGFGGVGAGEGGGIGAVAGGLGEWFVTASLAALLVVVLLVFLLLRGRYR